MNPSNRSNQGYFELGVDFNTWIEIKAILMSAKCKIITYIKGKRGLLSRNSNIII